MIVAGLNDYHQISIFSNNAFNANKLPFVYPPLPSEIDFSQLKSYSTYYQHSVKVENDGTAYVIGSNGQNGLFKLLPKKITQWTKISIENYQFISVVCGINYVLCLLKSEEEYKPPCLAYFLDEKNGGAPIFIDTKGHVPLAIFGGRKSAAAIDDQGNVIVIQIINHQANIISLPNNEKAIYVACLEKILFILSENYKVYEYSLTDSFQGIRQNEELEGERIISISGTWHHALAVTNDFRVYGRGANKHGQLCMNNKLIPSKFVMIANLNNKNIVSAFAGSYHSLFIDNKGKVYSFGQNEKGELLLKQPYKKKEKSLFTFAETYVSEGAQFCIAGCQISCVFKSNPPPNTPNRKIKKFITNSVYTSGPVSNPVSGPISDPKVSFDLQTAHSYNSIEISLSVFKPASKSDSNSLIEQNEDISNKSNVPVLTPPQDLASGKNTSPASISILPSSVPPAYIELSTNPNSVPIPNSLPIRKTTKNNRRNRKRINLNHLEEIKEISSQMNSISKTCYKINSQIQDLQNEKMRMLQNLNQIGKIIDALSTLKKKPKNSTQKETSNKIEDKIPQTNENEIDKNKVHHTIPKILQKNNLKSNSIINKEKETGTKSNANKALSILITKSNNDNVEENTKKQLIISKNENKNDDTNDKDETNKSLKNKVLIQLNKNGNSEENPKKQITITKKNQDKNDDKVKITINSNNNSSKNPIVISKSNQNDDDILQESKSNTDSVKNKVSITLNQRRNDDFKTKIQIDKPNSNQPNNKREKAIEIMLGNKNENKTENPHKNKLVITKKNDQ